jgi:ABC-type Fe3+ transport system substrate-binding protein
LTDFLQPQWKGKIATTPYAASYDILAANDLWGPKKTLDFISRLSGQASGLIRCGDVERIATGEFAALVMECTDNATRVWQERGAPVGYAIPAVPRRSDITTFPSRRTRSIRTRQRSSRSIW